VSRRRPPKRLCLALCLARATAAAPASASPPSAERLFAEAQRAFDLGKFEQAHLQFSRVADDVRSPNAAFLAARALQKLGRLPEAFEAMDRAVMLATARLADDDGYRPTRDAAAAEREAIATEVARVIVAVADAPPGLELHVGGRSLGTSDLGRTLAVARASCRSTQGPPAECRSRSAFDSQPGSSRRSRSR